MLALEKAVRWLHDRHRVCHTADVATNDDIKEQMRKALEVKKQKSAGKGTGPTSSEAKVHEHADREGGKREFRRKSG
jgi:hypothetical protein